MPFGVFFPDESTVMPAFCSNYFRRELPFPSLSFSGVLYLLTILTFRGSFATAFKFSLGGFYFVDGDSCGRLRVDSFFGDWFIIVAWWSARLYYIYFVNFRNAKGSSCSEPRRDICFFFPRGSCSSTFCSILLLKYGRSDGGKIAPSVASFIILFCRMASSNLRRFFWSPIGDVPAFWREWRLSLVVNGSAEASIYILNFFPGKFYSEGDEFASGGKRVYFGGCDIELLCCID